MSLFPVVKLTRDAAGKVTGAAELATPTTAEQISAMVGFPALTDLVCDSAIGNTLTNALFFGSGAVTQNKMSTGRWFEGLFKQVSTVPYRLN